MKQHQHQHLQVNMEAIINKACRGKTTMREEKEENELNSVKIHKILKKKNWGRIPRPTFQEEEGLVCMLLSFPWY